MIHTNGLHRTREKGSREAASPRKCNDTKTFHHDQPNSASHSDVPQSTADKHVRRKEKKDEVSHCTGAGVKEGIELMQQVSSDVAMLGRTPAMRDRGSNEDISSMIHPKQKEHQSPDKKHTDLCTKVTIRGISTSGGSTDSGVTKLPSTGKNTKSSPNGHINTSPPKLEKEASSPKYTNSECSPPKINTKCGLSAATVIDKCDTSVTSENSNDLAELEKQKCADDKMKDLQKALGDGLGTCATESDVESVDVIKGKCCGDLAGEEKDSSSDVNSREKSVSIKENRSSREKTKNCRNLPLSRLIERMQGSISGVTSNEDVGSMIDSGESADDESDSSQSSDDDDDDDSEEDDTGDDDEEEEKASEKYTTGPSGSQQACKVTCGQQCEVICPVQSKVASPSDEHKDEPGRERPLQDGHRAGDDNIDGPLLACSTAHGPNTGPLSDEPDGPDDDSLHLNADGPQTKGLPISDTHPSSANPEHQEKVTDGGFIVDCDAVETIDSDDNTTTDKDMFNSYKDLSVLQQEMAKPPVTLSKDFSTNTASTSDLSTDIGKKSGDGNVNLYSVFEKPAPLTKKRAAAFASTDLDRYLAKHSDLQHPLVSGNNVAMSKTNTLNKDVLQIDGINFMSFPTREMLRTHTAQEKERVRYIDTATMLQQKWGSGDMKVEPAPVSSGWQKTDDVRKIKGWKKRLLSTDDSATSAVEVTVSCKSERLHWRSEEKLVKMLTPEQLKDMGLKLKHKRRRHTPYTQSKHHAASDTPQPTSIINLIDRSHDQYNEHSVNYGDTELKPAGDRHSYVIKIFGRKSDGKFAPKKRKEEIGRGLKRQKEYSGLLSGSPSSVQKFQMMLNRKNLSVGLSSKFCNNIETAQQFRIVDNQLIASDAEKDSWKTVPHQRMGSDASELPEGLRRLEAVVLTRSMALAAVASLQQSIRANCKKPGCRYSCVCHLCEVMSAGDSDAIDLDLVQIKTCDKEYCHLGCICDTADSASGGSAGNQGWNVLDTSVDSSFDNTCSFIDGDDTKKRYSTGSLAQKRHSSKECDRDAKKRCSTSDVPIIPTEGFSQELANLLHPGTTNTSVATETTAKPEVDTPKGVRKSSRLKDKCGIGIVDRLRSLIYFDTAFWLQDDKPRKQKKQQRRQQQLAEQKQQKQQQQLQPPELQYSRVKNLLRDSSIASHQKNITMVELSSDDDDEIVSKAPRKRLPDKAPARTTSSSSYRKYTKNLLSTLQTSPTAGFTIQMVVLERKSKLPTSPGRSNTEHSPSSMLPHLLEIESDCNWQKGRYKILSDIARLAESTSDYPEPITFRVDQFIVRILEKPNQLTNIPPHLQKSLKTKQMYALRIQITETPDNVSVNQLGISALGHMKVSGHVDPNTLNGNATSKDTDEPPTFSDYWAETDCGIVASHESGFGSKLQSAYAPSRRSAQVEEARLALEEARRALTTELAKVKREREESFDASDTGITSAVGGIVKDQSEEMTAPPLDNAVKVEGRSSLECSLVPPVPTLVPAPHVRSPRQPVPVAVVQNVAHSMQLGDSVMETTGGCGYDGCDNPVTEVMYTSCHDDIDAVAMSSIDDLLMTDDSSSLENTTETLEYSSSGNSSSLKSEGDAESGDHVYFNCLSVGENFTKSRRLQECHKSNLVLSHCIGDRHEKNAVKVTKYVHVYRERVRRGQLSVKFDNLRKLLHPTEIPGQRLSKQVILSMAVKTVHKVSRANKHWLELKKRELQRRAELMARLNQLKADESSDLTIPQLTVTLKFETATPRGADTSQKVAPPKHCESTKRVEEVVDTEIYAVSSESNDEDNVSATLP